MVKLYDEGIYLVNGTEIVPESEAAKVQALTGKAANKEEAKKGTMACSILSAHNTSGDMEHLKLKFDAMTSHDITFVGIIQTARAKIKYFYTLNRKHWKAHALSAENSRKFTLLFIRIYCFPVHRECDRSLKQISVHPDEKDAAHKLCQTLCNGKPQSASLGRS